MSPKKTIDEIRDEQKKQCFEPCFNTAKVCTDYEKCGYRGSCIFQVTPNKYLF